MFRDRVDAGLAVAPLLRAYRGSDAVVLGIPRGGVIVAGEVARELALPLDIVVTRKLGSPWHPEYAVGAIGESGVRIVDERALRSSKISEKVLAEVEAAERGELARRSAVFRAGTPRRAVTGTVAIVVDDGVATGSTAVAACRAVRQLGASLIVVAVPVAPAGWIDRLAPEADELYAVRTPHNFFSVGQWYGRFDQTSDAEVIACLAENRRDA